MDTMDGFQRKHFDDHGIKRTGGLNNTNNSSITVACEKNSSMQNSKPPFPSSVCAHLMFSTLLSKEIADCKGHLLRMYSTIRLCLQTALD